MSSTASWSRRDWFLVVLAVVGWAGFAGTAGQLSVSHDATQAQQRAEKAQRLLESVQRQNDAIFDASKKLSQEQDQVIKTLEFKVAALEQRLKKYEP
jgi:hypothetical protein